MEIKIEEFIVPEDLVILRDSRMLVGANISNTTRRYLYRVLRNAGYTSYVARRCRHWHLRDIKGLLSIRGVSNVSMLE